MPYLKHSGLVTSKRVGVWMHYVIRESADETCKAQLKFMEENLSKLPRFCADRERLREFQEQKGCNALPPPKRAAGIATSRTGQTDRGAEFGCAWQESAAGTMMAKETVGPEMPVGVCYDACRQAE